MKLYKMIEVNSFILVSKNYGNPFKVSVFSPTCKAKDKTSVYIKFV